MAESRTLMSLFSLWGRNLPTLVMPPGSAVLLAAIIAIAGWEIGLNMPYAVSDILAVRSMGTVAFGVATGDTSWQQAFSAIYSTLKAMPTPSTPAVASAIILATTLLVAAGGWIRTSLALVQGEDPTETTWWQGVQRSWVSTLWFLILAGMAFTAIGISAIAGTAVLRGVVTGTLSAGTPTFLAAGGALVMFFVSTVGALYGISVTSLTGIVAIAEPRTPFLKLPGRARRIFKAADGWAFLRQLSLLLSLWVVLKTLAYQLVIPFAPVAEPFTQAASAGGAVLYALLTVGDGLFLLLAILLAAKTYLHGKDQV
ncbi:hypothetical protein D3C86_612850 [compost metagenome]